MVLNSAYARGFGKLASCGLVPPKSEPGHSDGWGLLSWANGLPIYLGREPSNAFQSKLYDQACEKIDRLKLKAPLIGHLRKASIGLKVVENTHPFVCRNWGFAHNGTIRKLHLKSTTDSQWFFESIMQEYERNGADMISAITERVNFVHEAYPYSSITFILSNGNELYAYRDCTKWHNYYEMYFTDTSDGMVFCQEKFFESNWQELQNRELIQVDSCLRFRIISLAAPRIQLAHA